MSFDSASTSNNFISNGTFISKSMNFDGNNDNAKSSLLQLSYFNVGSAYTQGNIVRSFYNMNSGPELIYTPTQEDINSVQNKYKNIFNRFEILKEFPWLYPYTETYPTVVTNSRTQPIYNILGKGLGKIEMYKTGSQKSGNYSESKPLWMEHYYNFNVHGKIPLQPKRKNNIELIYPFSGKLYAGSIVQYTFEDGDIKVIPFQTGRGIPQWDITQDYYTGAPFGIPKFENGITIEPYLSPGVSSGNNDFCVGATTDTQGNNKLFNYTKPNLTNEQLKFPPWNDHPAPFTVEPQNVSYNRNIILHTPPNSSGSYWAPWSDIYAYNTDNQTPVMSKGKTSLKIGAATNIGMQCYYEPDVEEGDDPRDNDNYLPVQCIPLFQGEKVLTGSEVYASHMGHVITWDLKGTSPYPVASIISTSGTNFLSTSQLLRPENVALSTGNIRDARSENPWWDYNDPTFGAIGWTSTPGFSLGSIPDMGVGIAESKQTDLPYLVQSTQGSVFVRGVSVANPIEDGGSGRMELIGSEEYTVENNSFQRINKMSGDSERSQIIGNSLQEIEGTGRWEYDGSYDLSTTFIESGYGYETSKTYNLIPLNEDSLGKFATIEVTSVDSNGSITGYTYTNIGENYTEGELVRVLELGYKELPPGTPQYNENSAVMVYSDTSLTFSGGGSNYKSKYNNIAFNISKNSGIVEITVKFSHISSPVDDNDIIDGFLGLPTLFTMTNVEDYSQFTPGRTFWAINFNTSAKLQKSSALILFYVKGNDGTTIDLGIYGNFTGESYSYLSGTHEYAIHFEDYYQPMRVTTICNSSGQVTDIKITDIGLGNESGDIFTIYQNGSNNNALFTLGTQTSPFVFPFIEGGSNYIYNHLLSLQWVSDKNYCDVVTTSGTSTDVDIRMISTSKSGSIYNLSWNHLDSLSPSEGVNEYNRTITNAAFGDKLILQQTIPLDLETQPVTYPAGGWDYYARRNTATFILDGYLKILRAGTGYTTGTTTLTGGSGTGMIVSINEVSDDGGILDISIIDYGSGMLPEEKVIVNGGDNNSRLQLFITPTDNILYTFSDIDGDDFIGTYMIFENEILNGGSGYIEGNTYTTLCPNRVGEDMLVRVDSVNADGSIEALTILTIGNAFYFLGNVITVEGGDNLGYFKLINPLDPKPIRWHKTGTNYTTATNVPTINITANNLVLLSDTDGGTCVPLDYTSASFDRPYFWDFSRYQNGDSLQIIQNGTNNSAEYTITFDAIDGSMSFTPVSAGSGYISNTQRYGWMSTYNTSTTETTVDIVADNLGNVVSVTLNTLGDRYRYGDELLINQAGSDLNCVVKLSPLKNVTPWWEEQINGRSPTAAQWNLYKSYLTSSVNLFDKQVVTDMKMNYPNYYNNSYYNNGDGGRDYVNNNGTTNCNIL